MMVKELKYLIVAKNGSLTWDSERGSKATRGLFINQQ